MKAKNNEPAKLVFIAGLGHSGSTLLNLLLGSQPNITGLGEIDVFINQEKRDWYLKRYDKYPCTCGQRPSKCSVWCDFKEYIEHNQHQPYENIYDELFKIVLQKTTTNIIADSSKNLQSLNQVYHSLSKIGLQKEQFYVIHLVKDVRNFTASCLQREANTNALRVFKNWTIANKKIDRFLKSNEINTIRVGYEELVLSPEFIMKKICGFISDEDPLQVSLDLTKSKSHIISGNNMRLDQKDSIRYDYRWFNNWKVNMLYSFIPGIQKLNEKWVYSNVSLSLDKKGRFKPPQKIA